MTEFTVYSSLNLCHFDIQKSLYRTDEKGREDVLQISKALVSALRINISAPLFSPLVVIR